MTFMTLLNPACTCKQTGRDFLADAATASRGKHLRILQVHWLMGPMHGSDFAILRKVNSVILEATRLRGSCLWVHARLVCALSLHRANSLYDGSWFVLIGKKNVHFSNVVIGTLRYIDHQSTRATSSENTSEITIDGNGCEIVGKEDPTSTHFNLETSLDRSGYGNDLETAFPKCRFVGQQLLAVGIKR